MSEGEEDSKPMLSWSRFWTISLSLTMLIMTVDQLLPWYFGFESFTNAVHYPALWVSTVFFLSFPVQLCFYFYVKKNTHFKPERVASYLLLFRALCLLVFFVVT